MVGTGHHQAAEVGAGRRLAFVAVGVAWGTSVFGSLVNGGFDDPKSESSQAQQLIDDRIGGVTTDVVVLFRNPTVTVEDPAYRTHGRHGDAAVPGGHRDRSTHLLGHPFAARSSAPIGTSPSSRCR